MDNSCILIEIRQSIIQKLGVFPGSVKENAKPNLSESKKAGLKQFQFTVNNVILL